MKRKLSRIILSVTLLAGFITVIHSCNKTKEFIPALENSLFSNAGTIGQYFITDDPKTEFKIPIGISARAKADRSVQFSVTSPTGAVEGQQYTLGTTTVTIPAGQSDFVLPLKGIFAGYPTGRKDTLNFKITGGDVPSIKSSNGYTVVLQKYCEVDLSEFTGTYTAQDFDASGAPDGGPYPVTITPGTVNANGTSGKIGISGLWGYAASFNVDLNWANAANFTTAIAVQPWFVHGTYGQSTIRPNGTHTFSSCDNTIKIGYEVTVAAGTFGKYTTILTK